MPANLPARANLSLSQLVCCLVAALLVATILAQPETALARDVQWHDATDFEIEGRGWPEATAPYDRLPDSAQGMVPDVAWQLSKDSAGMCVRFVTDASVVYTSWTLTRTALDMPHMPATGVSGVDLYARTTGRQWRFIGNGRPHHVMNEARFEFPEHLQGSRECLLYLPLYNGIRGLQIGVNGGSRLEPAPPRPVERRQPIVVYGTSIAQGGCASRPGMVWSAILGRLLDRPMINLGFSSSGTMEPPVGDLLAELDPAAYVIDCIWNMGDLSQEEYSRRVGSLVRSIRSKHPQTPIIFVGQSLIHSESHPTGFTRKQEAAVAALQAEGVEGLTVIPGTGLIGDDGEGTVDGVHLNDLGMDRQAHYLAPIVSSLLR
ncbi:lysophospholipase [bacterium]|nr:lysophospholipase [bacterium]